MERLRSQLIGSNCFPAKQESHSAKRASDQIQIRLPAGEHGEPLRCSAETVPVVFKGGGGGGKQHQHSCVIED